MAGVAIVNNSAKRNYLDHDEYCNGFVQWYVQGLTIIEAEVEAARLQQEAPLESPLQYEAFHCW